MHEPTEDEQALPESGVARTPRTYLENIGTGLILVGLAAILAMSIGVGALQPELVGYGLLMLPVGIFVVGLADGMSNGVRHPGAIVGLALFYLILSLWDLLQLFLILPFLVLSIVMGPFMFVIFLAALVLLFLYLLELIGITFSGVSGLESP
ncbi:MAG: hypothetical protein HQL50_08450, partial [Magnetococcales bacterium]|nr:hypothetical protein [Magnetococcales bacterium]